jgi:predicted AAA+ superfamily ATPase
MAITNHERVGKAVELLRAGLAPFVEREFRDRYKGQALAEAQRFVATERLDSDKPITRWDAAPLLRLMWEAWNEVFRRVLGQAERTLVSELRDVRNKWAHQEHFTTDDAYRALDSAGRLLTAVSAPQAEEVEKLKLELLRVRFDEQVRTEKRKAASAVIETHAAGTLKPWREVVSPHKDVASGKYQQAEFAADLWQVYLGEGTDEYRKPAEFFRRTYLTESLRRLLLGAARRITVGGGDPVIQLQTNFGGGKTHSMLALFHLFSGASPKDLAGVDTVLEEAGVQKLPKVQRVVLVGNRISPGNPVKKSDGTLVRTLWGELAWQLGGKKGYARVAADDERATSPGDALRELLNEYGPCVILIDEWVAYARQLHENGDLPAGSFETQFTFAQLLTESAKAAKNCLLVVSLPASDTAGSPHTQADDAEVGGQRGREALDRLRNVIGRVESSWRPASAEEGFEIVRRRLFEPLVTKEQYVARDSVAREFYDLYRSQHQEFPPECRDPDYERRLKDAYPIHPEIFDRLYTDWSTLVKFQRTRGVLRLMAAVIHSLWEKGDRNPLILPASIPIDDPRVQFELTRYLSDNWVPVIEKDVDGPNSLPLRLDAEKANLGKFSACRRVARTIYLGSAPIATAAHRGLEDRRIKLGCVIPGESPAVFGDALRYLAGVATYLYQDGPHYWYATQPTVTKLADDLAEQLLREPDKVTHEIERRVRVEVARTGDFSRVHPLPQSSQDVPDDTDARLVVLGTEQAHTKEPKSQAITAAQQILETRGTIPRIYRNTLVFLALDKTRLQELDEAVRRYLAWSAILLEKDQHGLSPHQVKHAEDQRSISERTVTSRLPEAYQWLLVPVQHAPDKPIEWQSLRLTGQDGLVARASKKLRNDELLITSYAATLLRLQLDRVPLWRGNHVAVRQLAEDYARFIYLPRLRGAEVLLEAIRSGPALITWSKDAFAYADGYDEESARYRGLQAGRQIHLADLNGPGLVVRAEVAAQQIEAETATPASTGKASGEAPAKPGEPVPPTRGGEPIPAPAKPKRYHGTVTLDTGRVGRDASRIADEVVAHLSGIVGSKVKVTLDIEAEIPSGAPDHVVRTVTENGRSLKFTSQGFEED